LPLCQHGRDKLYSSTRFNRQSKKTVQQKTKNKKNKKTKKNKKRQVYI